ncbi:MAG: hypothetical protein AMXMBFR67_17860 [Nitrospira sp.]
MGLLHAPLQPPKQDEGLGQPILLFNRSQRRMKIHKKIPKHQEVIFDRTRIDPLTQGADDLLRDKPVEVFDGRQMGTGITAGEFEGSGDTLKEGLEGIGPIRS